MANPTMTLIASVTVGSGGATSMNFTSIPQTYTDLKVLLSEYAGNGGPTPRVRFNGSSSGYSEKLLYGDGSTAASASSSGADHFEWITNGTTGASNIFGNAEFYIPNYTSSNYKSVSGDSVQEANTTATSTYLDAGLWSNTAAITSISIYAYFGAFAQYSTAYLYGISNS
jgi:hypothetical protein